MAFSFTLYRHHFGDTFLKCCRCFKMSAVCKENEDYKAAVSALNGLQTNASVLEQARARRNGERKPRELTQMYKFLARTGLKAGDLDALNAIHVTGTKGKGSVCAMCESILRKHGLKTGFYSSPHLLEVRERIRINGRPLTKTQFSFYFWDCYNKLAKNKEEHEGKMPAYFRFLTVMAFNVFLIEKVDVAVVEVGIGGSYDSTNIIRNPVVCAMTSLGYDHVDILGDTLEQIAWQKGGICKPGHPMLAVPQLPGPMGVLAERTTELNASSLQVVPDLSAYPGRKVELALAGGHQTLNASLAAQLCRTWLQETQRWDKARGSSLPNGFAENTLHGVKIAKPFMLPEEFYEGLEQCVWAGRNQTISRSGITYYLDGAHTPQSVKVGVEWFKKTADKEAETISGSVVRVLLFNATGKRNVRPLLQQLMSCDVDFALFCPNIADYESMNSADQTNFMVTKEGQCARTKENESVWLHLHQQAESQTTDHVTKLTNEEGAIGPVTSPPVTQVFNCIKDALQWCASDRDPILSNPNASFPHPPPLRITKADHIQLLVMGSLHLVGTVMNVLGCSVDDV